LYNFYRRLQQGITLADHEVAEWEKSNTLGRKVMKRAKDCDWKVPGNLTEITAEFHEQLKKFEWKWKPSTPCGDKAMAAKILDGEMHHAECQVAANSFLLLLTLKKPYGFGVEAELSTYSGEKTLIGVESCSAPSAKNTKRCPNSNEGFYSYHPTEGVHSLKPNVFDCQTNKLAALYAWTNHKVVRVGSRYYDVCYNAAYGTLNEMALAFTLGENQSTLKAKTPEEFLKLQRETKVMIKNWFQIAYFRTTIPNSMEAQIGATEMGVYSESMFGDEKTVMHPYGHLVPISKWTGVV